MKGNYTKDLVVGRIKQYKTTSFCQVCPIGQAPRFFCFGGMQSSREYVKTKPKPKVKNPPAADSILFLSYYPFQSQYFIMFLH